MADDHWFQAADSGATGGSVRVEAALGLSNRILVRGEAGSGKSTLLRWLAITAARGEFRNDLADWNGCVPVLIKLRSHADTPLPLPEQFLQSTAGPMTGPVPAGWTHRQLEAGRVLLLVDGVDELSAGQRPKVRQWLRALLNRYPATRIVVTSRPAAAGIPWLTAESFTSVDLENMTPSDIREFLDRWHKALVAAGGTANTLPFSQTEIDSHRRSLLSQLGARAHLRSLARSPLMCAMLCALHLDRGGDLPRDRKSLYEAALEMLLDRRDVARDIPTGQEISLPYRAKLSVLQDLAFWLNLNGRAEIHKEVALDRIHRKLAAIPGVEATPDICLNHLLERSGVIREPAEGRIDFVHRTFQEFLAAREAADDGHIGLLIDKTHSDQWRETTIMAAGLLNRPNRAELIGGILDRADHASHRARRRMRLLAAACRESVHELPTDLLTRLNENIHTLTPPRTVEESRSLATVGESILDQLPGDLTALSTAQASACVLTAALVNGPRSLELLRTCARDTRVEVQDELIDAWPLYDPGEYASTVLADAPLHCGAVLVEDVRLLPHLHKLAHLNCTHIDIAWTYTKDLQFLDEAPRVRSLRIMTQDDLVIDRISKHSEIRSVTLLSFSELRGLEHLGSLQELTSLFVNQDHGLDSVEFLQDLGHIVDLRIGDLEGVTDFRPLSAVTNLRSLILDGGDHTAALDAVPAPELLQGLHLLSGRHAPARPLSEQFSNLTTLSLLDVPDIGAIDLSGLHRVHSVSLGIGSEALLAKLEELPALKQIFLGQEGTIDLSALTSSDVTVMLGPLTTVRGLESLSTGVRIDRMTPGPSSNTESKRRRRLVYNRGK